MSLSNEAHLLIRQEAPDDHKLVFHLIEQAFLDLAYSDQREQYLVERLRASSSFIPQLSLVAIIDNSLVGYICLSKIEIAGPIGENVSLAMAPVAVHPDFQRKGIGSQLITQAHKKAKELGYKSVVVIGHQDYYPKFGYQLASKFAICFPFDVPQENCFCIELVHGGLAGVQGEVVYDSAFFEA